MTNRFSRLGLVATVAIWVASSPPAAAQDVAYTVAMPHLTGGLLHVTMEIDDAPGDTIDVAMPAWSPGGYGLHWASKNVQELRAEDGDGQPLDAVQVDTSRWRIRPAAPTVRVHYKVYVGPRSMDDSFVRISGTRSLMYVVGDPPYPATGPVTIAVDAPAEWTFATGLTATGPGVFTAPDYDTLIDSPIDVAEQLDLLTFDDHGARYEVAIRNPHGYDPEHFIGEIKAIVAEQAEMMGGVPFDRYVFLLTGQNRRGGGLEHLNSTTISFKRYDDLDSADYHRLQFLFAHEFFHLWNVKRIRPEILGPFDYSGAQHTRNLYVSEGMSDYYGYLSVTRAGLWTRPEFYAELAKVIDTLQSAPGRLVTSVESASWNAWTRSDNSAHTGISYYIKGSLVGLLIDLEMRERTDGRASLDDVFRYLMAEHGLPKPGFAEDGGFQAAVELITAEAGGDRDFSELFERYVSGIEELDYNAALQHVGLRLETDRGQPRRSLGVSMAVDADRLVVSAIPPTGAGYNAGLMAGDVILMLDGDRAVPSTFEARLQAKAAGDPIELLVARGDRVVTVPVRLQNDRATTYRIVEMPNATDRAVSLREAWLTPYMTP
ncbi:MAG: PDZ domain-containing protein [Vicinamibacterales bacterium]|nr:hypothetical protein [Acidobacteriota bacterium]MDP6371560.1 PDZ domain-containing protein [Vicinamibacterales bacterium]MDP6609608.1 PDZ domain-containing protein [Vicinamibacterales bacterium]HAK55137.1 hypothetical protein [Acidobacteriota bacterium]